MASWRELASQQTQDDLDHLLDAVMPSARKLVEEYGQFFPYAVVLDTPGEVLAFPPPPTPREGRPADDGLAMLLQELSDERNILRAVAVVTHVRAPSPAIQVELEHYEGAAIAVVVPYRWKRFGRTVAYGKPDVRDGKAVVWP